MLNAIILVGQLSLLVFLDFFGAPIFRLFGKWSRLDVIFAVFLLESLYSPGCIDVLLLTRVERMAHRADFCVDFFGCATGLKSAATAAMNHHLIVFWMYSFFHNCNALKYPIP